MKVEVGDYVQYDTPGLDCVGVVVRVFDKPYNMGSIYTIATPNGSVATVESGEIVADFDRTRSDHHEWSGNQQSEYDSLQALGRTLYDQLRTRLGLAHDVAFEFARTNVGLKESC